MNYYLKMGSDFIEFLLEDIRQVSRADLRPRLLVSLGIAVLMLTPFVRVNCISRV